MKIAITADPMIPVPPENYGGIERIIDFLVKGLQENGHEVVLVAHRESKVNCKLIPYANDEQNLSAHFNNIIKINELRKFKPDLIHSFSRIAYLLPFFRSSVPKIMSYQRAPTLSQIKKAMRLVKGNTLSFTGCSDYISHQITPFAPVTTIYNGVKLSNYVLNERVAVNSPLIFLGRIEPIKGTHIAIDVALKSKRKLIIAGNIPSEHQDYFTQQVAPYLGDQITYVGVVNDRQKNELLRNSAALLMPVQWNEPFGIVMAEAMACGTPVIGFNRGALPEIIQNNKTGFVCATTDEMANSILKIAKIDRKFVRAECENRFSSQVIVDEYLKLYRSKI